MNLRCIALKGSVSFFFAFWIFFSPQESFGQASSFDTTAFYRHLKEEGLLMEQIAFAQRLRSRFSQDQERKDSLSLDLAVAYLRIKMPDSCISNSKQISADPKFSEIKKELYFSSLVLSGEYDMAERKISMLDSKRSVNDARASFYMLKRQKLISDSSDKNISPVISDLRSRYAHTPHPSPFLAGAFSAVLPGAGKWYVGYKRQAFTAFVANALFAVQAAESYSKAGLSSPQFIITAGLFSIFYSGNIWGSVQAAKKRKRDHLNEIDYEILDHYHTEFSKLSR